MVCFIIGSSLLPQGSLLVCVCVCINDYFFYNIMLDIGERAFQFIFPVVMSYR